MSSDEESPEEKIKMPQGWKGKIKLIYAGIQRDLGPETPNDPITKRDLRDKLLEVYLLIYSRQTLSNWSIKLPLVLKELMKLLKEELNWATWWDKELDECCKDFSRLGTHITDQGQLRSALN
jgi:hypothetical protein